MTRAKYLAQRFYSPAEAAKWVMKSNIVQIEPLAVRPEGAAKMLDITVDQLQELVRSGWLTPAVSSPASTRQLQHD